MTKNGGMLMIKKYKSSTFFSSTLFCSDKPPKRSDWVWHSKVEETSDFDYKNMYHSKVTHLFPLCCDFHEPEISKTAAKLDFNSSANEWPGPRQTWLNINNNEHTVRTSSRSQLQAAELRNNVNQTLHPHSIQWHLLVDKQILHLSWRQARLMIYSYFV